MQHVKGNERNVGIGNYSTNPKKIPLYPSKNWRFVGLDLLLLHGHGQLGSSRKFLHHLMDYVWDRHFGENPACPGPQHDAAGTRWPEAGSTTTAVVCSSSSMYGRPSVPGSPFLVSATVSHAAVFSPISGSGGRARSGGGGRQPLSRTTMAYFSFTAGGGGGCLYPFGLLVLHTGNSGFI